MIEEEMEDVEVVEKSAEKGNGERSEEEPPVLVAKVPPPPEPYKLPKGVLRQGDSFLVHPDGLLNRIAKGEDLHPISRSAFFITLVMGAAYGVVMGGSNWLQGSPIPWGTEFLIMLVTAIKVPCLFLITLAIVVPPHLRIQHLCRRPH